MANSQTGWSLQTVLAATLSITATLALSNSSAQAQITPDQTLGSESSVVTPDVTINGAPADRIDGGAARGANLFHSFIDFNVLNNQRVYFADPAGIENIISRVTGNNVSNIYGTLGVDGAANLYLINPHGVVFGPNAQLDIRGSFLVGTAESVNFADGSQFRATNPNAAPLVTVNIPVGVQFGADAPAALVNEGNLAVGQNLHIVAGAVTSTGNLSAGGQVSVEGTRGDVHIRTVTADSALLSARGDLELTESQIRTTHDLTLQAQDTVRVRDSVATPVSITAGGDLTIRGEQGIDILALNHAATPFVSGGDLALISDGLISGDSHYTSGGDFSILDLSGNAGNFFSLYDPIILSNNNVSFGNYTGTSLKVVAGGNITATGTITINAPETAAAVTGDADAATLTGNAALILRAGTNPASTTTLPTTQGGATFNETTGGAGGNITVTGAITALDTTSVTPVAASIELAATGGNISTAAIASGGSGTNGTVSLTTTAGTITTGAITAGGSGGTGSVTANAAGNLTVGAITSGGGAGTGSVALTATGNNRTATLNGAISTTNGNISVTATGTNSTIAVNNDVTASSTGNTTFSGDVTLGAAATISGNTVSFANTLALATNNLTVSASEADFGGNVSGAGTLTIQTSTAAGNITIGGSGSTTDLDLTATEIGFFQNSLTGITIGRADGTGTLTLTNLADNAFASAVNIAGGSTLVGPSGATTWNLTANNAGTLNNDFTSGLTFNSIETITAGAGSDTVVGTSGADSFTVTGTNAGSVASISFSNIEAFDGAGGSDTVTGTAGADSFTVTGTNAGSISSIAASNIEAFDGAGGSDTVTGTAGADSFTVTGTNAGSISSIAASNIEAFDGAGGSDTVTGTAGADSFTVTGTNAGSISGIDASNIETFDGAGGSDTITGTSGADTFSITASNTGSISSIAFQSAENLAGGSGDDTFSFTTNTATITGTIDGGANTDTLDYSATSANRTISLASLTNIEAVVGGTGTDTVQGTASNETFAIATSPATNAGTVGGVSFTNIDAFDGNGGSDTVTGTSNAETFNITATGFSVVGIGFSNVATINAQDGNDIFSLADGASITGLTINAGLGTDRLSFANYTTAVSVALSTLSGFEEVQGSTQTGVSSTLTGANTANTWTISAANSGTVGSISFLNFTDLVGGTDVDTFNINIDGVNSLNGGDGNDGFIFANGVNYTGTINGGNGTTDYLDYSAFTTDPNVALASVGTGIEEVRGSTQVGVTSTLTGQNNANTWTINGTNSGTVDTTTFTNFTHLVGGTNTDNFTVAAGGSVTSLSGGNNSDTFTFNGGTVTTVNGGNGTDTFTLNGGTVTTLNGDGGNDTFSLTSGTATTVNGDAGQDTFNLGAATVATIDGGNGATDNDTINGTTGNDRFQISGTEAGTISQTNGIATTTTFQEIENLSAGLGDDTFAFNDGVATNAIALDGGTGGTDTLNFAAYTTNLSVDLAQVGTSIEAITGTLLATTSELSGFNAANTWNITGTNSGTMTSGATTITFSNFNTLTGNTNVDTFNLSGGTITTLNGGDGSDAFNLTSGTVTTANGGNAADTFTVNGATAGTLNAGDGNDTLNLTSGTVTTANGDAGQDTFNLGAAAVASISGGSGATDTDTINGTTGNDTFQITGSEAGTITQANGAATTTAFQDIETLSAGLGNDTFAFNNGVVTTAIAINGGGPGDTDTLDFSAYTTNVTVDLSQVGNGIEAVTGTNLATISELIGFNAANTWNITGSNSGTATDGTTTLAFTNFNTLTGNNNVDTFNLNGGSITTLSGSGGSDVFNLTSGTVTTADGGTAADTFTLGGATATTLNGGDGNDAFALTSGAATNVNGDAGQDTFALGSASVSAINGGNGATDNDTIAGTAGNDTFQISGTEAGTITQTNGANTSTTFQEIENLNAGLGNDTFAFNDGVATTAIAFNGGGPGDTDTLDFSAYTTNLSVDLPQVGSSIEAVRGTTQATTSELVGFNAANTWNVTGTNSGNVTSGATTIAFSNFNTLTGNSNVDTFNLNGGSATTLTGNAGSDVFNLTSGTITTADGGNDQDTFTLGTGASVSTITGGSGGTDNDTLQGTTGNDSVTLTGTEAGTVNTTTFSDIENFNGNGGNTALVGTAGDDTLTLQTSSSLTLQGVTFDAIASFDGSTGNDTIIGTGGNDNFSITGTSTGQATQINGVATTFGFSNVENLNGAAGNDTFAFGNGVSTTAVSIDGGAGTADTLDFSAYTTNLTLDLNTLINNIEVVNGSTSSPTSTLLGFNGNTTWNITGANSGTVTSGVTTVTFNNFNTLTGNTFIDTFNLANGGSITTMSGGDGNDDFNFANGSSATSADGGNGADTFTLNGAAIATNLSGGAGDDQFELNNSATTTGTIDGGSDTDMLDYSTYNADVAVNLAANTATGTGGISNLESYAGDGGQSNTLTGLSTANDWTISGVNSGDVNGITFTNFQNFVGGGDTDTFSWDPTGSIQNGTINGGAGLLALQSDSTLNFTGATGSNDITGTQSVSLQQVTPGVGIQFDNSGSGLNVNINGALVSTLSSSFTDISIGNSDTGAVTLGNNTLTFQSPTTIQGASITADPGGDISTNGQNLTLTAYGAGGIDVQDITTASTTGNGGDVRLTADVGDIITGAIDTSSTTGLGGSIGITAPQGDVTLQGSITTAGDQGGGQVEIEGVNVIATNIDIGAQTQGNGAAAQIASLQNTINFLVFIQGIYQSLCSSGFSGFCGVSNFISFIVGDLQSQVTALQNGTLIPGSLAITATNDIALTGVTLSTSSSGTGNIDGGSISLQAGRNITISDTTISSSTSSTLGDSGDVTLTAGGNINVLANSLIETSTIGSATGQGGDLTMRSGGNLNVTDSIISASSLSSAATIAGNVTLTVGGLSLSNGKILAETSANQLTGSGFVTANGVVGLNLTGGNITLTGSGASILAMSNDSLISARAIQTGAASAGLTNNSNSSVAGGNIFISGFGTVQAFAAGPAGNDIVTSASNLNYGGVIDISPSVVNGFTILSGSQDFGVLRSNGTNDISSNGTIAVFDLVLNDESSTTPIAFIDPSDLIGNSCSNASADGSNFTVSGRGGLPTNPTQPLSSAADSDDWVTLEAEGQQAHAATYSVAQQPPGQNHQGVCGQSFLSLLNAIAQ